MMTPENVSWLAENGIHELLGKMLQSYSTQRERNANLQVSWDVRAGAGATGSVMAVRRWCLL